MSSRKASHAGSWYTDNGSRLKAQMEGWLGEVKLTLQDGSLRGLIGPHAGFSYSGPTAAHAYKHINPEKVKRIFLLGPSHHFYTDGCELTACKRYETPVGDIKIDEAMVAELMKTGKFKKMSLGVDEDEHSMEMHLPYIAHVMKGKAFTLVPILVGSLSTKSEKMYGELLAPYLQDPANFFVISSDFCHWGSRFRYNWYDKAEGAIWQSIEALDRKGMKLIENLDPKGFASYLKEYRNTICGRHPIGVFLNAIAAFKGKEKAEMKFVKYAQSNQVTNKSDSSVSYASAVCQFCAPDESKE
eukprot:CAMPEP_0184487486 /NCGR_PEP_ID=MMETSP0113_2-20130426/10142_1 /TAXON_ID=91329 /ORGANISM="Norrisiella sphaerica, Strain BC52" /LENGTH=299 /DNA_ID=CAMNT_0026869817 /DNA_START=13 /DNA_END=912 /DNA_ORIENTATION=+